jgi:hypothetical protein
LGFCRSRHGDHGYAVSLYKEAVARDEKSPAWVYNNLAFGITMSAGNSRDALKRAADAAGTALVLDGTLRAARLNRAWAQFLCHLDKRRRVLDLAGVPGLEDDLQAVMAAGPPIWEAYLLAGLTYAASAANQPGRLARAIDCLEQGVRHGLSPSLIKSDIVLQTHLGDCRDFVELCDRPVQAPPANRSNPRLAEPPVR